MTEKKLLHDINANASAISSMTLNPWLAQMIPEKQCELTHEDLMHLLDLSCKVQDDVKTLIDINNSERRNYNGSQYSNTRTARSYPCDTKQ